jgi:hypothetical protein
LSHKKFAVVLLAFAVCLEPLILVAKLRRNEEGIARMMRRAIRLFIQSI